MSAAEAKGHLSICTYPNVRRCVHAHENAQKDSTCANTRKVLIKIRTIATKEEWRGWGNGYSTQWHRCTLGITSCVQWRQRGLDLFTHQCTLVALFAPIYVIIKPT